jgi:hypothetical protein
MKNNLIILILINPFIGILTSCSFCELSEKDAREKQFLLILEKKYPDAVYLKMEGKSLETGKHTIFLDNSRYWTQYVDYMDAGDTIIKKKGELVLSIHKKDTVLSFPWQCEGKIYK